MYKITNLLRSIKSNLLLEYVVLLMKYLQASEQESEQAGSGADRQGAREEGGGACTALGCGRHLWGPGEGEEGGG